MSTGTAEEAVTGIERWLPLARRIFLSLGLIVSAAGVAFVALGLRRQWPRVRPVLGHIQPVWVLAAVALTGAALLYAAVLWARPLAMVGVRYRTTDVASMYFRGEIAKYVPGGIWATVGRGELARRSGTPGRAAYVSVAISLAAVFTAAAALGAVLLPLAPVTNAPWWTLALLPLGLVGLHPRVVTAGLGWIGARHLGFSAPPWTAAIALVVAYVPVWLAFGATTWCVSTAVGAHFALTSLLTATVLSRLAGTLTIPAPAGLGVEEATFVLMMHGHDAGLAAVVVVGTRLVTMTVDLTSAAVAVLLRPHVNHATVLDPTVPADQTLEHVGEG